MKRPLFTVVLTTYDRLDLLRRATESVLSQTLGDWELLVVDDAGPSPAQDPVGDHRIKVIRRRQNGGLAASRNTGIDAATGRYIAFLDDDDLYMPDRLELVLPALDRAPIAICWSRYLFESGNVNGRLLAGNVHDHILDAITPPLGATTIDRDHVLRFNESYQASQDVEWWIRMSAQAEVATVPEVGYLVRRHQGVRHRNTRSARIDASIRMLETEHPDFFVSRPRAASFRWKRIGLQAMSDGNYSLARKAFLRSLRHRRDLRTIVHLGRAVSRMQPRSQ